MHIVEEEGTKYHHFTISNYGECWTSRDVVYDLTKLGVEETCVDYNFLQCDLETPTECAGVGDSQYVYHVHYKDEPEEIELPHSACSIETQTVCTPPTSIASVHR